MATTTLDRKLDAGNPHVRFDEGEVASAKPRRGSLLYTIAALFVAAVLPSFAAAAINYSWSTCQGLTGVGDNFQIDNVVGFVQSYRDGSSGFDKYNRHYLDMKAGQTATLTFTLATRVGNTSLRVAVAPYTLSGGKQSTGRGSVWYSIPLEIFANQESMDYAASAGWGFKSFNGSSFTITIKCLSEVHSSGGTDYAYSVTDSIGTKTFEGYWPDEVKDIVKPYRRAGVAIYLTTDIGSVANHDYSISYSISGMVSMDAGGGGTTTAPANDNFASATTISGASGSKTGSNVGATNQSGEPTHGESGASNSVWWKWTAPSSGRVTFTTEGSSFYLH